MARRDLGVLCQQRDRRHLEYLPALRLGEFDQPDEKGIVRCKWHGWRFDTFTGKCLTYRIATSLRRYSHRERDGDLEILREIGGANDAS